MDKNGWNRMLRNGFTKGNSNSIINQGYSRWKISYSPHADGTDRGNPRDAGELYACRITK